MAFKFHPIKPHALYSDTPTQWSNWVWQMQNRLESEREYALLFDLSESERKGFEISKDVFKISTTPYYASLATQAPALRPIMMPTSAEAEPGSQSMLDPLGESRHSATDRLIHRYSDRVLFLVTDTCSVYCRFCTRKRFTGHDQGFLNSKEYSKSLEYIKKHKGIREVILSGGDPLTLSNTNIDKILSDLRQIDHIEILRLGSRMPVVCPMRVDDGLAAVLRKHAPVFMMTHFNHPRELTAEAAEALTHLVDKGVPVLNQSVLLNGMNNHVNIIQALNRRLLYLRVKPYYLFQCDPSEGTDHLRTTLESSEALVREMWGHLSGLAMASLSVDIPHGGGKTTLVPNFTISQNQAEREFEGWDGVKSKYVNPTTKELLPQDYLEYEEEWNTLKNSKTNTHL